MRFHRAPEGNIILLRSLEILLRPPQVWEGVPGAARTQDWSGRGGGSQEQPVPRIGLGGGQEQPVPRIGLGGGGGVPGAARTQDWSGRGGGPRSSPYPGLVWEGVPAYQPGEMRQRETSDKAAKSS